MKKNLLFLVSALFLAIAPVFAYDFSAVAPTGQTLYYNIRGSNAVVTYPNYYWDDYTQPTGSLTIPASVAYGGQSYSVTAIGDEAFGFCRDLNFVTIPNSVTSIGEMAFSSCSRLASVTIGDSVTTIGDRAFFGCSSLSSVIIPNSVTSISEWAFCGCRDLTSVTIGNSVISIGKMAFNNCSDLTSVTIPNSVISIGSEAFGQCSRLDSVTIGNSVSSIGEYAFSGCSRISAIICKAVVPPLVADANAFDGVQKDLSLTVPYESVSEYQNAYAWRDFTRIIGATMGLGIGKAIPEYEIVSNNGSIAISGAEGQYLHISDIQGRMIVSEKAVAGKTYTMPSDGIYLIRIGCYPAQKVLVVK